MNTTSATPGSERSLLMDLLAVTPSATLGRELLALVVNIAAISILSAVIQPEPVVSVVMVGVIVVFMVGRLVAGVATRGYAQGLTGGR